MLVLQHAESEGLGTIQDALIAAGVEFECVRSFEVQSIPRDIDESSGLIVMGGPMDAYETDRFPFLNREMKLIETFLKAQRPILGVCLGSQLLAVALGARVRKRKEIGWFPVNLTPVTAQGLLWGGQPSRFVAYHLRADMLDPPKGAVPLASWDITPVQSFRFGERAYGILFHMEVTEGQIWKMLKEFAGKIQQENLDAEGIMLQAGFPLPPLQQIGTTIFRRWVELI
jgi:GMP synthase (glutamine-hydrolysing)